MKEQIRQDREARSAKFKTEKETREGNQRKKVAEKDASVEALKKSKIDRFVSESLLHLSFNDNYSGNYGNLTYILALCYESCSFVLHKKSFPLAPLEVSKTCDCID